MKHKPAMYALLRLHANLGGKILDNRKQAVSLRADMRHVEAVLRMLEPGFDVTKIAARRRYKVNPSFRRGECFRCALDVLRAAGRPLTVTEIAKDIFAGRGISNAATHAKHTMEAAVRASLGNHEGKTVKRVGEGIPSRWAI